MSRDVKQSLNKEEQKEEQKPPQARWEQRLSHVYHYSTRWGRRLPPGLRSILGVLFLVGGVLGFLPVLGFWMIPLGLGLIVSDCLLLRRRLKQWWSRREGVRKK